MQHGLRSSLTSTSAFIAALVFACSSSVSLAGSTVDPAGIWLTQAGDAKVHVSRCGQAICGRVVWLKQPIDGATGKPQTDDKNPDPSLKKRPIIGLQLFADMRPAKANTWSGRIYNADSGQTYASTVTQLDPARLEVRGCVGALCGSELWTRTSR
ncbi:DUF2147 domain-containing protein [Bradyrhizobium paxllaeri]|uniref:DUF2147 domain-containing protein n=1 Tax=Bradyrhizobium paxllaeri TaxID=190148 RepID=UPI0009FE1E97|nr:DUF2147 domain-containing protein [Bradyrhizobium paxllaeri]